MNIKFENLYGSQSRKKSNLGNESLTQIIVRTENYEEYGNKDIIDFMQYIKNNYNWYTEAFGTSEELKELQQGKFTKDNYELYIWSDGDGYFQITLEYNKIGLTRCKEIQQQLLNALNTQFKYHHIDVLFQIDHILDKEKIENFLMNYKLDINTLPSAIEKFSTIDLTCSNCPKISIESINKLIEIENHVYNILEDKKVVVNGIEGKFKKLADGAYGFFKKRVRKSYYNFKLNSITSLQIL